jgi:hypothetical protein
MASCNGTISVNKFFFVGFLQIFLDFSKVPVFLGHPVCLTVGQVGQIMYRFLGSGKNYLSNSPVISDFELCMFRGS